MHQFVHACAGAGKTQSIIDRCVNDEKSTRRLIVTLTLTGQNELEGRLKEACSPARLPDVSGWYSFLIHHCIRPYLPLLFPNAKVMGFSFPPDDSKDKKDRAKYIRFQRGDSTLRYFDSNWCIFQETIENLAFAVMMEAGGLVEARLARIYDELVIDEAQDISRKGLDIIDLLLNQNALNFYSVGDTRQSLIDSSLFSPRNKSTDRLELINWYRSREKSGILQISELSTTYRSNALISHFSDSIFPPRFSFSPTRSANKAVTGHDGVFLVLKDDLDAYMKLYSPTPLRGSKATAKHLSHLGFENIGQVKGRTFARVLIAATGPIDNFLKGKEYLVDKSACGFYVGVTRARYSVAIVPQKPTKPFLQNLLPEVQIWSPMQE
ncbi:AAA family ATPase [Corynebacterium alimapuense]|uniref:Uncharacterized protein n=1 Tax=Corynebacterium alimapuense TaxID=1576874 RepID=A0A3M8K746_9CORY|nr:AAA family ATPase [Corynebacterium alimapuense]RNE48334.1 hypothetical protein C5L39_07380 [Corynebacterium alimapuense]